MEWVGLGVDAFGVLVMLIGVAAATWRFCFPKEDTHLGRYMTYRQEVGRAILLGLEFLIAADLIRTVLVETTMENVAVLGLIVLIRTFLSIALEVELEGCWPWHRRQKEGEKRKDSEAEAAR